jgi:hypothetical protein
MAWAILRHPGAYERACIGQVLVKEVDGEQWNLRRISYHSDCSDRAVSSMRGFLRLHGGFLPLSSLQAVQELFHLSLCGGDTLQFQFLLAQWSASNTSRFPNENEPI